MMLRNRTTLLAVLLIVALGLLTLGSAGQSKRSKRGKSRKATANTNVAPAPTPAVAVIPAEPEPAKKNERHASPTAESPATPPAVKDRDAPRYTYEFTQPASLNTRILIEHDQNGQGTITFARKTFADPVTDPIQLSDAAWARIKALWVALNFLESDLEYQSERQYPHMGTVHLKLQQGSRQRAAEFNWSLDKDATALAAEYRRVGEQAMLNFDIAFARESQPLSAPDLMRRFETMLKQGGFSDAKQMTPLLKDLTVDERIPLIARNHAARLLKQVEK